MLHIAVEREGQPRKELRFAKDVVVVGREAEHDLQLNFEDGASRQHARLSNERGQHYVEDLGSRNGTKVNGKRIAAKTAIKPGDEVEVGKVKIYLVDQAGAGGSRGTARVRPAGEDDQITMQATTRPAAKPKAAAPEPAPKARAAAPEPAPKARPAPEPAKPAAKASKPAPEPEAGLPDSSIKVNLRQSEPEPAPAAEPEGKPTGPVNDENESCRSQIDPLARRWRDLGKPESLLLTGPLLKRGLAWAVSDRKLRPRPSELHREFIYASRGDRRHRIRDLGLRAGALTIALVGGNVAAHVLHDDLVLKDAAAGREAGAGQCTPDHPTVQRANQLAQKASEQTDLELAILAGVRAVSAADGPCARQSDAERALRIALSRQRSRVLGRGPSPIRDADVGRDERDVVTVDDTGTVTLYDRTGTSQPRQMPSSSGAGKVAALGPEGRWLVVGTAKGIVDLWDLKERSAPKLTRQLESHRDPVTSIAFSEDGRFFATGDRRGNVTVWDMRGADAGGKLGELRLHTGAIEQLVFRDGGTRLYSFGGKQAIATDLQDGRKKGKHITLAIGGDATAFAVNGEGDEVVVGDSIGQVVRWRVRTLARAQQDALASHNGPVLDLAFLPGARAVLSLGADKQLIVTELDQMMREGSEPLRVGLRGLAAEPEALAADPTGRRIAVAARDNKIYVWDAVQRHTSAQPVVVFDEHTDEIEAMLPSFDGNSLLSASADGTVRLWPLQNADAGGALAVLSDHRGPVTGLGLSSDGGRLASLGQDKALRAWRLDARGAPRRILERTFEAAPQALAVSPDGAWAAVGVERQLLVYGLGAGDREPKPIERNQHDDNISHVAFSPDNRWLVTADFSGAIHTWSMRQDGPEDSPARSIALGRSVSALALAPNSYFAVGAADNRVTLWPMSGNTGEHLVFQHDKTVLSLAFSGGGDFLVSTSDDARAILRAVDKGKTSELPERSAVAHDSRVRAAAFSPDKRWLATGSDDGVINMTDLKKTTETRKLKGHETAITSLAFEPGSELLVSASADKTLRLWLVDDLDRGGEVRSIPLTGHAGPVTSVRVDGGGRLLASAGADGAIRVWPLKHDLLLALACRTVGRDLSDEEWSTLYSGEPIEPLCEGR
ncbi:FHA domain-containing protein [Nannocystis radixulma]|uniref:FHA domain-containing protein n=1 Tax=Nannocystis radixulma TaxID=2995305 RepID=A0ABT5BQP1_9BACT|nr:FHA domain-containing protein [Nannocystis radixulma]MDC0675880.1 FHA domain-containing protein [Nannocystis radixulma]